MKGPALKKPAAPSSEMRRPAAAAQARGLAVEMLRHADIVVHMRRGARERLGALGEKDASLECPFCGRCSSDRRWAKAHAKSHEDGKLACIHKTLVESTQVSHPVFAAVERALYDDDAINGRAPGNYLSRAKDLLAQWIGFAATPGSDESIYTATGRKRDCDLVFVLTETGPEYWRRGDDRLTRARKFGNHYYTLEFGNAFARFLFEAGGVHSRALRMLQSHWARGGCQVGGLARRHTSTMTALMLDIAESDAIRDFGASHPRKCADLGGLRSISVDAT